MTTGQTKSAKKLVKEDEFALFMAKAQDWFETNWRYVAYGAAGVVAIAIVIWAISISRANANRDAGYELAEARSYLGKGEYSTATDKMKSLIQRRKGTDVAEEAMLTLGRIKLVEAKYADAEKSFRDFLKMRSSGVRAIGATNGIAVCLEAQGKLAEAYDHFLKVYEMDKTGITAAQALYDAARVAMNMNDREKAKLNALKVMHDFPTSTLKQQCDDILLRTGR